MCLKLLFEIPLVGNKDFFHLIMLKSNYYKILSVYAQNIPRIFTSHTGLFSVLTNSILESKYKYVMGRPGMATGGIPVHVQFQLLYPTCFSSLFSVSFSVSFSF